MTLADDFNLRSRHNAKLNDIADAIDALRVVRSSIKQGGSQNTTATTRTDMTSMSITLGVEANQFVQLTVGYLFSHGTQNNTASLFIDRDGTNLTTSEQACRAFRSNTGGADQGIYMAIQDAPGAGTYTYKLQWATNSGTLYSVRQWMTALVLRGV